VSSTGCRISDQIADCKVGTDGHDAFVSCVDRLAGALSGAQKDALRACARKSRG
jgi:hypothetical protein